MSTNLKDRSALVTGATTGIGRAIALALAEQGAHVIATGRDTGRGAAVVAEIEQAGGRADFVAADLADGAAAVEALAGRATELADGRLDVLVNNAALLLMPQPTGELPEQLIDRAFAISVRAPILLTGRIAPEMARAGGGAIVNIGSISGVTGSAGSALYSATKATLHSLTKSWAAEYGPAGVRVNTVAPGPTSTENNQKIEDRLNEMVAATPGGRLSTPAEVAASVVFLAGDGAANIHGATLFVDGGFTSR
ncbi:short-chain dehydrogenase [Acrocarpospora phusangensis]|uniref:Short-chain dehydrogenase n=1 Tax=Acrocarpospora phusangensis TaxID=1070424 RepID=A0A919QE09_9ACTN|nr:SDR family oxidoreductase [Acrocarpospora phusangensis]GIH25723.1 short-chain dehydrogenase [Acrocarpospora phusangensis]